MDSSLIDHLVKLTGKDADEINQVVDNLTMSDLYDIIDLSNKGDEQALLNKFNSYSQVEETMKKKTTIKVDLPKPVDPLAKAMATDPKFQVRGDKKNKHQTLNKMNNKHKGRIDDSFDASSSSEDQETVSEGIMGMTAMPAMKRMLELAGQYVDEASIEKAMEDMFSVPQDPLPDFSKFGVDTVPTGTRITPGLVDLTPAQTDLAAELDAAMGDNVSDLTVDPEPEIEPEFEVDPEVGQLTSIQCIRDSFEVIRSNLNSVKVSEFNEVRDMLSDLMSHIDRLGNHISGK